MLSVKKSQAISAPINRVWDIISDFGAISSFHPAVENSPLLSSNTSGVGARRRCEFYDETSVVEEVTEWREGRGFTVVLSETSMPFEHAVAEFELFPEERNRTQASISMNFKPKYGVAGLIMATLLLKPMMKRMFSRVLIGLDDHLATGMKVGRKGRLYKG